jgi:uncharacterized protein (TIGR02217 family)
MDILGSRRARGLRHPLARLANPTIFGGGGGGGGGSSSLPTFIESPRFVPAPQWDCDYQPDFGTVVIRRASARERRYLPSEFYIGKLTITIPDDRLADVFYLRRLYRAVRGKTIGFRVQNPEDYLSCDVYDPILGTTGIPTPLDQPLVLLSGTAGADGSTYQLTKEYAIGSTGTGDKLAYDKLVVKPVNAASVAGAFPLQIANDSGDTADPSTWSCDYTTGIITVTGFTGTPSTWGGQYDTVMRFDSPLVTHVENGIVTALNFDLVEYPL